MGRGGGGGKKHYFHTLVKNLKQVPKKKIMLLPRPCLPKRQRVCSPIFRFCSILSTKLSGFHSSVQNGTETVSPKRYSCRPQHPTALMMEALCTTLHCTPSSAALSNRSVWVVALAQRRCGHFFFWEGGGGGGGMHLGVVPMCYHCLP